MNARVFVPLYKQFADEIADAITEGRLPAGSSLPSLRESSAQRRLSMNTVVAAYRLLEDRGLIISRPQSGFEVCGVLAEPDLPLVANVTSVSADPHGELMTCLLKSQREPGTLDLAFASPKGKQFFPSDALARITRYVIQAQRDLVSSYVLPPGSELLISEIAKRGVRLGMSLDANKICLTHGTTEALQLALRATTKPGDSVGIESPSYFNIYPLLDSLGLHGVDIPTHPSSGLITEHVEQLFVGGKIAALVCMPTVHNPLGCTMSQSDKQLLVSLADTYRIPIIEDCIYAELQLCEPLEPALKAFDVNGWVLVCGGFSKTLAPDYRVGWLEGGRYSSQIQRLKFCSSASESMLLCETIGLLLKDGGYERHLKSLRKIYRNQLNTVRSLVARFFPTGTRATQPTGGFVLWIEFPDGVDTGELALRALQEKIVLMPGELYSRGPRFKNCIRLSCCIEVNTRYVSAIMRIGELAAEQLMMSHPHNETVL